MEIGKLTLPSGIVYEGELVNGKPHGKGKFTCSDGVYYKGDVIGCKILGKGKMFDGYEFINIKFINKHIYTWVGTFLFGFFGGHLFMRGDIGSGIFRFLLNGIGPVGVVLFFIDWITALNKLSLYDKDFIFANGEWAYENHSWNRYGGKFIR